MQRSPEQFCDVIARVTIKESTSVVSMCVLNASDSMEMQLSEFFEREQCEMKSDMRLPSVSANRAT
jgi:hypothetical protein